MKWTLRMWKCTVVWAALSELSLSSPCAAKFYEIWHTRSTAHQRNHVVKFLVDRFRSSDFWHPKIALSHWLAASPLQQCRTCDTVITQWPQIATVIEGVAMPSKNNLLMLVCRKKCAADGWMCHFGLWRHHATWWVQRIFSSR